MMQRGFAEEMISSRPMKKARFGVFELDIRNRELRRRGLRVRLQEKPFQILDLLLDQAGKVVTRSQLARHLWPGLHVNFDRSLNTAMNSLRRALGDSAENPRFIETRAGLGYRFIAPVEPIDEQDAAPQTTTLEKVYAGNQDAYHDYLKGRYFQNKMTEEDLSRSVAYFEAALGADPNCALAYCGLADTHGLRAFLGILPASEAHSRAKGLVDAALRIDSRLAEAQTTLANLKKLYEWDWAGAEAAYKNALQLKPGYADSHRMYAALLSALERHAEALPCIRRAQQLDPLSLSINAEVAWDLYMARDFEGAAEQAWKTLAMEPRFAPAQHALGLAYQHMNMLDEAIVEFENARACSANHPATVAALACAYALAGQCLKARELVQELEQLSERRHASAYFVALAHAGLKEDAAAIQWLEKALAERDVWLVWLRAEPRFDLLRSAGGVDNIMLSLRLSGVPSPGISRAG
jgi:DNA-binding winged helix-turn-helix (wHTH) protein